MCSWYFRINRQRSFMRQQNTRRMKRNGTSYLDCICCMYVCADWLFFENKLVISIGLNGSATDPSLNQNTASVFLFHWTRLHISLIRKYRWLSMKKIHYLQRMTYLHHKIIDSHIDLKWMWNGILSVWGFHFSGTIYIIDSSEDNATFVIWPYGHSTRLSCKRPVVRLRFWTFEWHYGFCFQR